MLEWIKPHRSVLAILVLVLAALACNATWGDVSELIEEVSAAGREDEVITEFSECIDQRMEGESFGLKRTYEEAFAYCRTNGPPWLNDYADDCPARNCSYAEWATEQAFAAETATAVLPETAVAEATAEKLATEQALKSSEPKPPGEETDEDPLSESPANDSSGNNTNEALPIAPEPNPESFCMIYQEMLDDLYQRIEEYEAAIDVAGSDLPDQIAMDADLALDAFYDRLLVVAPDDIRPAVETIAAGSLLGLLSSPDGVPELEDDFELVSDYANANCDLIIPEVGE